MTAHRLGELLHRKEITSREITRSVFDRIEKVEGRIHAYITLLPDLALKQAGEAEARIQKGEAGPLTGFPVAIKDLICTAGIRTTCGSHILDNFVPTYDKHPRKVVIVITGYATASSAVEAMKRGAFDFLPKPFTPEDCA